MIEKLSDIMQRQVDCTDATTVPKWVVRNWIKEAKHLEAVLYDARLRNLNLNAELGSLIKAVDNASLNAKFVYVKPQGDQGD